MSSITSLTNNNLDSNLSEQTNIPHLNRVSSETKTITSAMASGICFSAYIFNQPLLMLLNIPLLILLICNPIVNRNKN